MSRGEDTSKHPNRQVSRTPHQDTAWKQAMDRAFYVSYGGNPFHLSEPYHLPVNTKEKLTMTADMLDENNKNPEEVGKRKKNVKVIDQEELDMAKRRDLR